MTIAVLSDIHGVLPALDAVLAEPDVAGAGTVVLLGDLAAGPMPGPTLDRLVALGPRALWVRGNADRELVVLARGGVGSIPDPIAAWAAGRLRPDQVDLLAGLDHPLRRDLPGFGPTVLCHATPRDDDEVVLVDTRLGRWDDVLAAVDAEVTTVVCGHTHMPFLRLAHRRLIVNPGSVGMPYGRSGAHWALLGDDGSVSLRRTVFDIDAACALIAAESGYPDAATWADHYLHARSGDADALAAFGPRDGRQ